MESIKILRHKLVLQENWTTCQVNYDNVFSQADSSVTVFV